MAGGRAGEGDGLLPALRGRDRGEAQAGPGRAPGAGGRCGRRSSNHRGYRLNALVELLPNAAWGKLADEWLKAKRGGPAELQVFVNLILGKPWKTSLNRLSAEVLAGRVEPIGLERIPPEIVLLTAGADVQDDRIEVCVLGWPLAGARLRCSPMP